MCLLITAKSPVVLSHQLHQFWRLFLYYMEVRPGLVCVLCFVDIKSDDYFSPCTHLSGAIPVNSEFGCWCIATSGCELSLQTCPCRLFCDFCSEMSLIHTRLSQLCSLWRVACCFVLWAACVCCVPDEKGAGGLAPLWPGFWAGRGAGWGCVHSVIPGAEFCCERSPEAVWELSPAGLLTRCYPRACGGRQGTLESWSSARQKEDKNGGLRASVCYARRTFWWKKFFLVAFEKLCVRGCKWAKVHRV